METPSRSPSHLPERNLLPPQKDATRFGRIVVSVFTHRNGLAAGKVPDRQLNDWNTGFIWYPLSGDVVQEWPVPNIHFTDEMMRLRWSPNWMDSQLYYRGRVGETLAQLNFTFHMDGKSYKEKYSFFDGFIILKYSGKWDS